MPYSISFKLANEDDTRIFAKRLAAKLSSGVIYLEGDLGAGKTTFTRYLLQQLGHAGTVKSPTYTLVEPYEVQGRAIFHFDLYRLNDPFELELMGVRDYLLDPEALLIFEWPSKGGDEIPAADTIINLEKNADDSRQVHLTTTDTLIYAAFSEQ